MPADLPAEPKLPGDLPNLPPLPGKPPKPRPRTACPRCGRRFDTVEEMNDHARRSHALEAAGDVPPGEPASGKGKE